MKLIKKFFTITIGIFFVSCLIWVASIFKPNNLDLSLKQANKLAYQVHLAESKTFYCDCSYSNKKISFKTCGYKISKNFKRAHRVELEHIVPVSVLAKKLTCWHKAICCKNKKCYKGRSCCEKIDPYYVKMATDLHNIVPEIGELNAIRSNYGFSELPYINSHQFGSCEFKIDRKIKKVECKDSKKGIVSRVYLYMADRYNLELTDSEKELFNKWNKKYPPSLWEITWNNKVYAIQKTDNRYISGYNY